MVKMNKKGFELSFQSVMIIIALITLLILATILLMNTQTGQKLAEEATNIFKSRG